MSASASVRIFLSYAHADAAWKNVLAIESLDLPGEMSLPWTDGMLRPGTAWDAGIREALEQATIAILLVSKRFLASEYISRVELTTVLRKRESDGLRLLWIPVGKLEGADLGELEAIQAVWKPKRPLPAKPSGDPEIARKTAVEVREAIEAAIDPIGVPLMRDLRPRYEAFEFIGRTGGAALYRTYDSSLRRRVVVKALADPLALAAFRTNLRDAVAIADEPHFANIYEAVLSGKRPYCTMQYIPGKNLRQRVETTGQLPLDHVIRILWTIAKALAAVHALGKDYGNLKPTNVVLSDKGETYILPMGRQIKECKGKLALAELRRRGPDAEEIAYLAPEQFEPQEVSGALSDQYMLGLLGYELVTGALPPTMGESMTVDAALDRIELLGSAAFRPLPPITELRPGCPEILARTIHKMINLASGERYKNIDELLAEVRGKEDLILASVRESYNRCLEHPVGGAGFFEIVYCNFFVRRSEAKAMFKRGVGPLQYKNLERAVTDLFAFYEQERVGEAREPNVLTQIARMHHRAELDVPVVFYESFSAALVDAACGTADDPQAAFDLSCRADPALQRTLRSAWENVLRPGVAYMTRRH
jgi:hypothetical protein